MSTLNQFILLVVFLKLASAGLPYCYMGEGSNGFVPTYVKDLFFPDIEVFATMGDSISTGTFAADLSTSSVNEYRGLSFSTGNATDVYSLTNLISQTQGVPIYGSSATNGVGLRSSGSYYPSYDGFNGATKGTDDDPYIQQVYIKNQITNMYGATGFQNKWKMINIYIGIFKACKMCNQMDSIYQANPLFWKSYYYNIITNVTNTFNKNVVFNFISLPQLTQFYSATPSTCRTYNINNNICPCLWTLNSTTLTSIINAANQGMRDAIQYWRANNNQAASSVGVQYFPYMSGITFPSTHLSPVDCFHPNKDGHKLMTIGLWNNIREYFTKSTSVTTSTNLICEDTFYSVFNPLANY